MCCLEGVCYVCLEEKKEINNINNPMSVNEDIMHIIGYLPFNLTWLKTKKIILICEVCCLRLRETYQFLEMCHKNSAILKSDMELLNSTTPISNIDNEAELTETLDLNVQQNHINEVKCEIKLEGNEIYTDEFEPGIEETEVAFVNVEDSFVKVENTWKSEEADEEKEYPIDDNSTEITDKESDSEKSVNMNAHITYTECVSTELTCEKVNVINEEKLNSFLKKYEGVHTGENPYTCSSCKKWFSRLVDLKTHMQIHIGKKPYTCFTCNKCFRNQWHLVSHMRTHTGEKPYTCSICKKCFREKSGVVRHMLIHTGERPHGCSECKRCFSRKSDLRRHMRLLHTGEKPFA